MKIVDVKINGIENPIGFSFPKIKCSWKVVETTGKYQVKSRIVVSTRQDFSEILWSREDHDLDWIGETIEITPKPRTRYYFYVEVTDDENNTAKSDVCFFETGKMTEKWKARFIGTDEDPSFHPCFVKDFSLKGTKEIRNGRIYVTGLGLYEAYLNGIKIGDDYLAPFCNDYNKGIQYQTYDITDLLKEENRLSIICGNGWYKGRLGYEGDVSYYGNKFGTIAELYVNGKLIVMTDESFSYCKSAIVSSDIYDGEVYDRACLKDQENETKPVKIWEDNNKTRSRLVERYSLPVVVKETLPVKEIIDTPAGEKVLDFGQNFTGYVSFKSELPAGTKVILDFGEVLQEGNFYNANYRTAKSQFTYVSDGTKEEVRPHFTYFGFRYARVTGWEGELCAEDFIGNVVYSDLETTVSIDTSDAKLNRLASNCIWGQKSNFLDMPTDCPQRDERLGWTGDAQVFAPTACFNMDTRAFYRKFLYDLHLDQVDHDGVVANFIPNISKAPGGSSVWGDVATFLPMTLYEYYADVDDLRANYPLMKDWVDHIIREDEEHGDNGLWNFGFHFGDWLAQDGISPQSMKGGTDDYFVASVYYYESLIKAGSAARILGYTDDSIRYARRAEKVNTAILNEYFSPSGRLTIDTQTAYLICLKYKIYISRDKIIEGLKLRLKKDCYKIKGGFVGATMMCQVLAENGMEDIAYYILFQEGFPGWMHCVNLGATTIWERWNSILDDGTISGTNMNSLNHYSYGSVMEYVYRFIAGIQPNSAGFRSAYIAPQLSSKLQYVDFEYNSVSGRYKSFWKINDDGTITVKVEVPFGCSAVYKLPGTNGEELQLQAGTFEKTYKPATDYRLMYSMDTRLGEFAEDARAVDIIKKDLPIAYKLMESKDVESLGLTLDELKNMFFMGFNPPMVMAAADKLLALKKEWN